VPRSRAKASGGPKKPAAGTTEPAAKVKSLDRLNIFAAVFGVIAIVVGLLSQIWLIAIIAALSVVVTFTIVAIIEKSIGWPAWRVIIALAVVLILLFIQYMPPKVTSFEINLSNFLSWSTVHGPTLDYYPITDNPQTGNQVDQLSSPDVVNVNVRCWTLGHLSGKLKVNVNWVSIKGGPYDGLWVPFEAINAGNPGLARDVPNCNSWWLKLWPF
jgi:hypothetical protein